MNSSDSKVCDAQCPICGISYQGDDSRLVWVCCDKCESWLDFKCTGLKKLLLSRLQILQFVFIIPYNYVIDGVSNAVVLLLCFCGGYCKTTIMSLIIIIIFLMVSHNMPHVL